MTFKLHTFLRGLIWETIGVLTLLGYAVITNSTEAFKIALWWPIFRSITYYPYERVFKYFDRKIRYKNLYRYTKIYCDAIERFENEGGK